MLPLGTELLWMVLGAAGGVLAASLGGRAWRGYRRRRLVRHLRAQLPDWPIRTALIAAVEELSELERGVALARDAGVPETLADRFAHEVRPALAAVRQTADRVAAAVGGLGQRRAAHLRWTAESTLYAAPTLMRVAGHLDHETVQVSRLAAAAQQARAALAELMLLGGAGRALADAELELRAISEATRELVTWHSSPTGPMLIPP